ncbi:hypothetical protein [Microcoleus sp. CAWBG58]|uniref:hypothetical protein n=1 Tax=Microcoleus sp. CAWBG58 TaxID=2841651 RepID=UPI0025F3845C|nr:hypothetical protein [Microcoleus sp. CAWBG58]
MNSLILISTPKGEAFNQFFLVNSGKANGENCYRVQIFEKWNGRPACHERRAGRPSHKLV